MTYTLNAGGKRVASFQYFKNAALMYNILKEYAISNEPVHSATLFLDGQKIVGVYYTGRTTRNCDRSRWRPMWEDSDGKTISAAEAKAKLAACKELF